MGTVPAQNSQLEMEKGGTKPTHRFHEIAVVFYVFSLCSEDWGDDADSRQSVHKHAEDPTAKRFEVPGGTTL